MFQTRALTGAGVRDAFRDQSAMTLRPGYAVSRLGIAALFDEIQRGKDRRSHRKNRQQHHGRSNLKGRLHWGKNYRVRLSWSNSPAMILWYLHAECRNKYGNDFRSDMLPLSLHV